MKAICSCLSLWVWLLWQCRETQAVEEEPPSTGKGKTAKSAKGKNGKTGKSSEGKTGKSGKSGVDGGDVSLFMWLSLRVGLVRVQPSTRAPSSYQRASIVLCVMDDVHPFLLWK